MMVMNNCQVMYAHLFSIDQFTLSFVTLTRSLYLPRLEILHLLKYFSSLI